MRGVASGKDDSEKDEKLGRAKKPSTKKKLNSGPSATNQEQTPKLQ